MHNLPILENIYNVVSCEVVQTVGFDIEYFLPVLELAYFPFIHDVDQVVERVVCNH